MSRELKKSASGLPEKRLRVLDRKRAALLSMDPEEALEKILEDPDAIALTHAFPPEDLYLLIHEIGTHDSLPLIAMSSNRQREFFLDQAIWSRDCFDGDAATRWLALLIEADPRRVIPWLVRDKSDLLEMYFFKNLEIRVLEHDQDPSDFGDDFFSLDGVYYFRIARQPDPEAASAGDVVANERNRMIHRLLEKIADYDQQLFQALIVETGQLISAEAEEEAYRLRNVRMSEKGFFPFEEAIGLYQQITRRRFEQVDGRRIHLPPDTSERLPVPYYPIESLVEDNLFVRTLRYMGAVEDLQEYQAEFAVFCNQIIAADQVAVDRREKLTAVVGKAGSYISIGLERLLPPEHRWLPETQICAQTADWVRQYPLARIFRFGFSAALETKWAADRWIRESWFGEQGLPLAFWGEEWMGLLGGLLVQKPVYFDNFRSGRKMYREFKSLEEIEECRRTLQEIMAFDRIFRRMGVSCRGERTVFLTYRSFLLTQWARHELGLPAVLEPIPVRRFRPFFDALFGGSPTAAGVKRHIPMDRREALLQYLSQSSKLSEYETSRRLGHALESLFSELSAEYGHVFSRDLDPRYTPHFLLAP